MEKDYWKADDYNSHARFVSQLTQEVITDLSPKRGDAILDLGCGDGVLTKELVQFGCSVTAIDNSPDFVKSARARGINALLQDSQTIAFDGEFDAVFSNAAMHWMPRQSELIGRVYRALKPGGRFVAEMGGAGNIAHLLKAMTAALGELGIDFADRNPWTFPNAQEQRRRLEKSGFRVDKCRLRDRPTLLPTDVRGWFVTFCQAIIADIETETREKLINRMVEHCRDALCDVSGNWTIDYVRLNFVAVKEHDTSR